MGRVDMDMKKSGSAEHDLLQCDAGTPKVRPVATPCAVPTLSDLDLSVLAEFLYHSGPFIHAVIQNINSYRSHCTINQVTPVKHLSW